MSKIAVAGVVMLCCVFAANVLSASTHPTDMTLLDQQVRYDVVPGRPASNVRGQVPFGEDLYVPQSRYEFTRARRQHGAVRPLPRRRCYTSLSGRSAGNALPRRRLGNPRATVAYHTARFRRRFEQQYADVYGSENTPAQYRLSPYSCTRAGDGFYRLSFVVHADVVDPYSGVRTTHRSTRTMNIYDAREGRLMETYLRHRRSGRLR